jgi:glycosyltransferase involved in cell wall biosynthesis
MKYSLVIPAYNEELTIERVIDKAQYFVDEIIVVDDCSTDKTVEICSGKDITLLKQTVNKGYTASLQDGLNLASYNIIFTMDGDLEHNPLDIPKFKELYKNNKTNIIVGQRKIIPRKSERVINAFFEELYNISDPLNGMKLIEKQVIEDIQFSRRDDYGLSFLTEAIKKGYTVQNYKITEMPRREASRHGEEDVVEKRFLKKLLPLIEELN